MTDAELAQKYVEQTSGKIYSSEDALRFQAYYDGRKDGRKEVEKHLPAEKKASEILWKPVYDEYRRIGYRLRRVDTNPQP